MGVSTETLAVKCSHCAVTYRIPAESVATRVQCKKCGRQLPVERKNETPVSRRTPSVTTSGRITAVGIPTLKKRAVSRGFVVTGVLTVLVIAAVVAFFI